MYISNNINKILIIFNNHYTQLLFNPLADNRKVRKNKLSNCHNCHSPSLTVLIFSRCCFSLGDWPFCHY